MWSGLCFALSLDSLVAAQGRAGVGWPPLHSFQHLSSDAEAEVGECLTEVPFILLCFCLCQSYPGARNLEKISAKGRQATGSALQLRKRLKNLTSL